MSYRGLVTASFALGRVLARRTREGERVGVLLPTSRAAVVTFFALQAERRVPAMLNFSTGAASAIAACRGAEIKLVVTARKFIEKAKLEPLIAALEPHTDHPLSRRRQAGDWHPVAAERSGALDRREA